MQIKNSQWHLAVLLAAALYLPALAPAQPMPSEPEAPPRASQPGMPPPQARVHMPSRMADHPGHPRFLHGLALSETQQDRIFMILHAIAPRLRELDRQRTRAERDLADLGLSGHYTDARAKPLAEAVSRANAESILLRARADSEIVALLTPEQRARLQDGMNRRPGAPAESPASGKP